MHNSLNTIHTYALEIIRKVATTLVNLTILITNDRTPGGKKIINSTVGVIMTGIGKRILNKDNFALVYITGC